MSPPAPPQIGIRPATADDGPALGRLHGNLFDPPWRADDFARLLTAATTVGLVALSHGAIVGVVLAQVVADEAEILTIAVALVQQGMGIGGALLDALLAHLAGRGVQQVHLEVAAGNAAARALYARAGFTVTGERPAYYAPTRAGTALTMVRWLEPIPDRRGDDGRAGPVGPI